MELTNHGRGLLASGIRMVQLKGKIRELAFGMFMYIMCNKELFN